MNHEENEMQLPEGLGFSMAMNMDAMKNFSNMSKAEQQRIIEKSRNVRTKAQMKELVDNIAKNGGQG